MARSWKDDEPGWETLRRELKVVRRRVRQRWLLTTFLTLVVTAGIVGWKSLRKPTYNASIVIRLVEQSFEENFDEDTRPATAIELTDYLYDISLSRPALLAVIEKYNLYPERQFDPTWAVESMKDDIDIDVVSNYFSPETYIENPVREARVVISYYGRDPRVAIEVARELGRLIATQETEVRQRITDLTARAGTDAKGALRDQLMRAKRELTQLNMVAQKTPLEIVRTRLLTEEIKALDHELQGFTRKAQDLSLRDALEEESLGMRFELVDPGEAPEVMLTHGETLLVLGVLSFFFCFPVVGIGVGTLDTRIYDADSIRRMGLTTLGQLPGFPGDDVATAEQRLRGTS